jgi:hypothetical protein
MAGESQPRGLESNSHGSKRRTGFELALERQDPWVKALYAGISKKRLIEAKEVLVAIGVKLENQT